MSDREWVALHDLESFRRCKRLADGVIVIRGSASTKVHHPDCPHVREDAFLEKLRNPSGGYFWAPSADSARRRWASARLCRHPSDPLAGGTGGPEASARHVPRTAPRSGSSWSVEGPTRGLRAVKAETDIRVPYEPQRPEQRELRSELRARLARLPSRDDEVLHASFFGAKPLGADVENLLLYNVDDTGRCFVGAARGVRFELSPRPLPRASREFIYLYRPVPRTDTLRLWRPLATLATWEAVEISTPRDRAAVWLDLRTAPKVVAMSAHADAFAVLARVRPPAGHATAAPPLVKPVFDGVVTALQAHTDRTTIGPVSARIANATRRPQADIADLLADAQQAVLGIVPRLIHLRGDGFQLAPADDRCVAGELLIGSPNEHSRWTLECSVVAVTPADRGA